MPAESDSLGPHALHAHPIGDGWPR